MMIIELAIGIAFALLSLWCVWRPVLPSAVAAYMSMILCHLSTAIYLSDNALIFWTIATLIIVSVNFAMPRKERGRRFGGVLYIAVAAVAGALIGMAFGSRYVTLAIIVGALLGEFAYLKTPRGRAGGFSFSEFYKYFCSEALNIIVTVAQLRLIVEGAVS